MPKLGIEIKNNVPSNISDFKKLDGSIDRVGKSVDTTQTKIKGLGSGLSKALGAFAIGGAVQKGISVIANDIEKAAADTVKNNRSAAQLYGQLGLKGVEAARSLATGEGFDLQRTQQLINDISSGTTASGIPFIEQQRLATLAIRAEKTVGIPAEVISGVGSKFINAAPGQFATQGGAKSVTNLIRGIGEFGNIPSLSDIRQGAQVVAAGAAADIPVPASESSAVFAFLTGSQDTSTAGASGAALLRKYQVLGGEKTFTQWLDDLLPLPAKDLQKMLGDAGAVGAVLAIKANPAGYRSIRKGLDERVSNPKSIIQKEFKKKLGEDKVFAATQAIDRANIANSVGATTDEALAILQASQKVGGVEDRFVAGATELGVGALDFVTRGLSFGQFGAEDVIGEGAVKTIESVSDRNIRELSNKDVAFETIGALREVTGAVQSKTAVDQVIQKTGGNY